MFEYRFVQQTIMKTSAITLLFLVLAIATLHAKAKKPKKEITFEEISRELYFSIDKFLVGAKVVVIDEHQNIIKEEILPTTNTILTFDDIPKSSYTLRVSKDQYTTEFFYNNMYCVVGFITLKKNSKVVDLDFLIPYELTTEAEQQAIELVSRQLRMNIDLVESENKLADISLDLISDHEFNLLIDSDTNDLNKPFLFFGKKQNPTIAKVNTERRNGR